METARSRWARWLIPARNQWKRVVLRMGVVIVILYLFRFEVLAWSLAAHNYGWKQWSGAETNHRGDIQLFCRLGAPGARMLARLGENYCLSQVQDAQMLPAVVDLSSRARTSATRAAATRAVSNFRDERVLPTLFAALNDAESEVRLAAAEGLAAHAGNADFSAIESAARQEPDGRIRAVLEAIVTPDPPAAQTVTVAAIQFESVLGDPVANRKNMIPLIRAAAGRGARIVVLPETAITGYVDGELSRVWQAGTRACPSGTRGLRPDPAETVPGPSTDEFGALALDLKIYLTVPILEVEPTTQRYFNTLVLVGPDGKILLHYRKLNPWPFAEASWASIGDRGLQTVDTEFGRLGLLICFDINFEAANLAARKVDHLLYSIAWVDVSKSAWFYKMLPNIARENRLNIIGANWCFAHAPAWWGYGQSLIISQTGRVLARATTNTNNEILYAQLCIAAKPTGASQ